MLSEYAYLLQEDGRLYTITDVEDLHNWHVEKCTAHPCFERLLDSDVEVSDPAVALMTVETEEGMKVARMGGKKFFAVFRRKRNEEVSSASPSFSTLCPAYKLFV